MLLRDIDFKKDYRTNENNLVKEFYLPALKVAKIYKRAVGFFSSTSLIQIIDGIKFIIKNEGKIQLIVSPKLSDEDIEAIYNGYNSKEAIIESSILNSLENLNSESDKKRLFVLSELIREGILEIKVAFISKEKKIGMYHEKIGVLVDENGDYLSFSGSMNESVTAFSYNVESIDVFKSWGDKDESERAESKLRVFDSLWRNNQSGLEIIEFPKVAVEKLEKVSAEMKSNNIALEKVIDDTDYCNEEGLDFYITQSAEDYYPKVPDNLNIRDYQSDAVQNWEYNGFTGIFDMATGTGKTITGLLALTRLFKLRKKLSVVIVAPYTHLVEQWVEDLNWFNINPIVGYSDKKYVNYKDKLKKQLENFTLGLIDFTCFITTNASFRTKGVQAIINDFPDDSLIIIDEAHNFGAKRLFFSLPNHISSRLALSATLDRHNDPEGTSDLYAYFGGKCIEYGLEKAIEQEMLTKYQYFPIVTYLTFDELDEYNRLTAEIAKFMKVVDGKVKISDNAKMLLLKRSRIVAGAQNKIDELEKIIVRFKGESNFLVYCGATNMIDDKYDEDEIRQIDFISRTLYEKFGIRSSQFTSKEDRTIRKKIIENFVDQTIQGIVAIKCLDEGVNIPSIKTAFILASSTNPKEYIQRRGRVLRKFPGKKTSTIYDFVVMPRLINDASLLTNIEKSSDLGLIRRELRRVYEFSNLSMNQAEGIKLINRVLGNYPQIKWDEILNIKEDII